ncbi:23S rRNA (adenine(2030)-N(6))-methyltransferase RlmJ, partial [Amaricoccus sp.]|uniref:23S rRNA (adenine(2030)-N(6))-methyltransferase RlmJ n=1 Tax=Amaricoccus sp. TaxID=1872485 RepID=UPI002BFB1CFB
LAAPEALKTGEAAAGVGPLAPAPATPFGRAVLRSRDLHGPVAYPGSPLVAGNLLRDQDRMVLFELHPAEHGALTGNFAGSGAAIHRRDGFEGALALAPFRPRKGLVLIDPSYELKSDYAAAARFVTALIRKWPEATVLLWYPILPAMRHETLKSHLAPLPVLVDEATFRAPPTRGMTGSGLILVNAPHHSETLFDRVHAQTAAVLRPDRSAMRQTRRRT